MRTRTRRKILKVSSAIFGVAAAGFLSPASASDDLASKATNPAAALIQLQLQDAYVPQQQNGTGYSNSGIIQPVYPFVLGEEYYFQSVITRTTIPIVTTPKIPITGRRTGLGDTAVLVVPAHRNSIGDQGEFFQWGPILATTLPTATSKYTGSGKLQAGPGLLGIRNFTEVLSGGDSFQLGAFGYQQWSIAGKSSREGVSKMYWAPIVVYHFDSSSSLKGMYAALPDDLWTYDWKASKWDQIPLGGRIGKVFTIGKQPINAFVQGWYNAANHGTSEYALKLNVTFLFPE